MILSYGLWVRRFRADPGVVGRVVQVNGHDCSIIGVMPAGFDFPMRLATTVSTPSGHMDFWAPDAIDPTRMHRDATEYGAIARLRPGISLSQAQQDLAVIAARLARAYPRTNKDRTLHAGWLRDRTLGFAQTGLLLLMAAALIFLMIGWANVTNLLLARSLARDREIAIRVALGAGRRRIVRQLLTESCVLAALGGLAGYALSALAWRLLPAVTPMSIPRLAAARADAPVFAFAIFVSVLTGLAVGLESGGDGIGWYALCIGVSRNCRCVRQSSPFPLTALRDRCDRSAGGDRRRANRQLRPTSANRSWFQYGPCAGFDYCRLRRPLPPSP
jgi:putative ABC transport system permease protein